MIGAWVCFGLLLLHRTGDKSTGRLNARVNLTLKKMLRPGRHIPFFFSTTAMAAAAVAARYFESFNSKLGEFLAELARTFPEVQDLRLLKSSFTLMRSLSERTPQKMFDSLVAAPFGDRINRRDESFFLAYDYAEIVKGIPGAERQQSMDIIGKIKSIWHTLNDDNKDVIWKYLAVLMFLNSKCNGVA